MLCATCGAMNPETAPRCGRCGTPLASTPGSLADQSSDRSWFAPVAHSPFSMEPLPQPSDALPQIQPGGDILTFTPLSERAAPDTPASLPPRDLADYPTQVRMPVVSPILSPLASMQNSFVGAPPGDRYNSPASQPQGYSSATPASSNYQFREPAESYTPAYQTQTPPDYFDGSAAAMYPTPPISQTLGNVYPGLLSNASQPQSSGKDSTGSLAGSEVHPFVRPMARWAFLASTAAGALLLGALVFFNSDWANGALIAGTVALIMATLLLIATGVRGSLGLLLETNPRRRAQLISIVLLVLLLFLVSGTGFTQQTGLHAMQARYLEGQQNWSTALQEFQLADGTPTDLARVYNEWGEDLSKQQHYAGAVARFSIVLQHYTQVSDQLARARTATLAAYLAWGNLDAHNQDYASATSHYDTLLGLNYCDPGCQSIGKPKDATAYAHLAEQQLTAQHFAPAVAAFTALTTRFANAPEAKQIHADYAKALWGLGQQQLTTTCSAAVKTYQQLGQQFTDTTQGQQAATALQQPVNVIGRFTKTLPGPPFKPSAALVQGLTVGMPMNQFPLLLRNAPQVPIQSDGTFTFTSVPQGTYELVWSNDSTLHYFYAHGATTVSYTAHIGPLCTYNYGDIGDPIPTQPSS